LIHLDIKKRIAINYMYISRDEPTLKDKLNIQTLADQLSIQFGSCNSLPSGLVLRIQEYHPLRLDEVLVKVAALNITDILINPTMAQVYLSP